MRRRILVAVAHSMVCLLAAARLAAQDQPTAAAPPRVRPTPDLRALVTEAAQRSEVIHSLIAEIEASDVFVYIRTQPLPADLDGRTALLAVNGGRRYLVIELSCAPSTLRQMVTLGHELFHAVEIAREPSVVDAGTMAAFYARVGIEVGGVPGRRMFETATAVDAGNRTRRQLRQGMRRTDGT